MTFFRKECQPRKTIKKKEGCIRGNERIRVQEEKLFSCADDSGSNPDSRIMKNLESMARKMIEDNIYMTIATATKNGKPWISPVFFAYDSKYNFYWGSSKNSLHSKLIRKNNRAAVVIFDSKVPEGTGDGVYMVGKASELPKKEIHYAMKFLFNRTGKKSEYYKKMKTEDYYGKSPVHLYKFVPSKFWVLENSVKVNGKLIDIRREVRVKN